MTEKVLGPEESARLATSWCTAGISEFIFTTLGALGELVNVFSAIVLVAHTSFHHSRVLFPRLAALAAFAMRALSELPFVRPTIDWSFWAAAG